MSVPGIQQTAVQPYPAYHPIVSNAARPEGIGEAPTSLATPTHVNNSAPFCFCWGSFIRRTLSATFACVQQLLHQFSLFLRRLICCGPKQNNASQPQQGAPLPEVNRQVGDMPAPGVQPPLAEVEMHDIDSIIGYCRTHARQLASELAQGDPYFEYQWFQTNMQVQRNRLYWTALMRTPTVTIEQGVFETEQPNRTMQLTEEETNTPQVCMYGKDAFLTFFNLEARDPDDILYAITSAAWDYGHEGLKSITHINRTAAFGGGFKFLQPRNFRLIDAQHVKCHDFLIERLQWRNNEGEERTQGLIMFPNGGFVLNSIATANRPLEATLFQALQHYPTLKEARCETTLEDDQNKTYLTIVLVSPTEKISLKYDCGSLPSQIDAVLANLPPPPPEHPIYTELRAHPTESPFERIRDILVRRQILT